MPIMSPQFYSILHVASAMLLIAATFQAFAAPTSDRKRKVMMATGILSLVMLVAGFGLQAKYHTGFPLWLIVKMVCWLGLAGVSGIAFKRPEAVGVLTKVTTVLIVVALIMVYLRPWV